MYIINNSFLGKWFVQYRINIYFYYLKGQKVPQKDQQEDVLNN